MDNTTLVVIICTAFPFVFVGMWCGVALLLSRIGGWHRLAEEFAANGDPTGTRFSMQSAKVGWVTYSNCLTIYGSENGLYLAPWRLFRLGHPPLFIPWEAIHNPTRRRVLLAETVVFDAGSPSIATLQLPKKVFEGHGVAAGVSARESCA